MNAKNIVRRRAPATGLEGLSPLLTRIYASRGVSNASELDLGLGRLAHFSGLKGIGEATELLLDALQRRSHILIVGDFDADGATSSALAMLALQAMGAAKVSYLVPNRFDYGYGLTPEIVEVAAARNPDLIITVDNGISSVAGVERARKLGIRVLVTDHHLAGEQLPEADAIVNPNQPGDGFVSKNLAGVGVIFYVMLALRDRLRESGWFDSQGLAEPNLAEFLDLVALGTVADVVPLDTNNRILVDQGLRRIRAGRCRPGIIALLRAGRREPERITAADLGFIVGPRLNAAGRLEDMSLGIECLLADDPGRARTMAMALDDINQQRRNIEADMQQQALEMLERIPAPESDAQRGLCLFHEDFHQGVVGLLASRLKERCNRPAVVFARSDSGELKGSARSVPEVHIRDTLANIAARHPDLIAKFGGHAMAAGLSLSAEGLDAFAEAFEAELARQLGDGAPANELLTDGELAATEMTMATAEELRNAGPWGQGFPEPEFDGEFILVNSRVVAEKHLKLTLRPAPDAPLVDAIAFNADVENWDESCERLRAVYRLDINVWRERSNLQLIVSDLAPLQ